MIRFKLMAALLLLAGLTQLAFAQPPIVPPNNCSINFDVGSPSSTVAGKVDAKGGYNIAKGWALEKIEVTVFLHGVPPGPIGVEAQKNLLFPPGLPKANVWETSFAGLPLGDNASVTARIYIVQTVNGKQVTESLSAKSGIIAIKK